MLKIKNSIHGMVITMVLTLLCGLWAPNAGAKPRSTSISVVPTITSISVVNGGLVASGTATAVIKGTTYTVPFNNVPVTVALAANQTGAGACPILDLTLGPINLNLLGLVVQTSPICLTITAYQNGGLLGALLCDIANLLNQGLSLSQILSGLTPGDLNTLLTGLTSLLNGALGNLLNAVLTAITPGTTHHTCAILNLELGPVNLTLLGLNVVLDNCANGPVTVTITGVTGQGNLLGNLLCELLGNGAISLGTTLQNIVNLIVGLLTV